MKKILITSTFILVCVAQSAYAASPLLATANDNGPISGTPIVFPKHGDIPSANVTTTVIHTQTAPEIGGIGNAESCTQVNGYHYYSMKGPGVSTLQAVLNDVMNTSIPVTGFYGPQTMAAVKKFQTSRGIKATGKQYRLTTDALNKAACSPSVAAVSSTSEFIEIGARGEVVSMIQQQLTAAGHPVPVTGYFGPVTEYAVGMYQKKQGLKITGIVGPITKARLAGETGSTLSTTTKVVAAKISESSPTVNVGDTKKMEASATEAAQAATPAQGMFTGITPWLLLALAALFAYLFGPWSERNLDAKKDTSAK